MYGALNNKIERHCIKKRLSNALRDWWIEEGGGMRADKGSTLPIRVRKVYW